MENKETFPFNTDKKSQLERKRRTHAIERARESKVGVAMYLMLSSIALRMSVQTERNPRMREARRNLLMRRWKQLSGDILQTPFPGVRLP